MDENPEPAVGVLGIYPRRSEYTVVEGKGTDILVDLINLTTSGEFFNLMVVNVPISGLKIYPPQPDFIEYGQKKQVTVTVTPQAGWARNYDAKFMVFRMVDGTQVGEADVQLTVTTASPPPAAEQKPDQPFIAFQSRGNIGVVLETVRFYVTPGGTPEPPIQVALTNNSLEVERLRIGVKSDQHGKEIPSSWISIQPASVELKPGVTQTLKVDILPPRKYSSKAGRYPFVIEVYSEGKSEPIDSVDCVLTVTAFSQPNIQVNPLQVFAGQTMQVSVENGGNTTETYEVAWEGRDRELLEFEVVPPPPALTTPGATTQAIGMTRLHQPSTPESAVLRVEAGKTGTLQFKATPTRSPVLGKSRRYLFQTRVAPADQSAKLFSCSLTAEPIIPQWAVVSFLLICVFSLCALVWLVNRSGKGDADQSSAVSTLVALSLTQTVSANQTATASGLIDSDGDGLSDSLEAGLGTNPSQQDTDLDGLVDGDEVNNRKTDPKKADTDEDGLVDGDEVGRALDPLVADTDGDGLKDGEEVRIGTDPKSPDTDQDGLTDQAEISTCHSATDPDADDDGILDGQDLNPCDKNNPSLTQTAVASMPTATPTPSQTSTLTPAPQTLTPTTVPPSATPTHTQTPGLPSLPGELLFSSNREGKLQIYSRDMGTGSITRLTVSNGDDTQPAWSPDGRRVVFTSNRDGDHDVYVMDANGANPINLTNDPADDLDPCWSSDGLWIAFSSNRDGNYEIYVMPTIGGPARNISRNPADDRQPFWGITSGDFGGRDTIFFVTDRDGNQEVYSMLVDGQSQLNLSNNGSQDYSPALSADGERIAFTSERNGNADIWLMDVDGSHAWNLTSSSQAADVSPTWSGDDQWIAYSTLLSGNPEIYIIKNDGSLQYNLTMLPADDRDPAWR